MKNVRKISIIDNIEYSSNDKILQELYSNAYANGNYILAKRYKNWEKLRWENNDKTNEISFEVGTLETYFYDKISNKLLLIFRNSNKYPNPNNAVVYNLDGSVFNILKIPKLIGYFIGNKKNIISGESFGGFPPSYMVNNKGEEVIGIVINHPYVVDYYYEIREVNLETGEFGEELSSGRY